MHTNYLIKTVKAPEWGSKEDDYHPNNWHKTSIENIYLHAEEEGDEIPSIMDMPELEGATVIGAWDSSGEIIGILDGVTYEQIRPLGNMSAQVLEGSPEVVIKAGGATGHLGYDCYFGHEMRNLEKGNLYPEDNSPYEITITRHYFKASREWGYLVGITANDKSRDPTVRHMGEYSDSNCEELVAETANFELYSNEAPEVLSILSRSRRIMRSDVDEEPVSMFLTKNPVVGGVGIRSLESDDINVALLLDDVQEGFITLPAGVESVTRLFWKGTQ